MFAHHLCFSKQFLSYLMLFTNYFRKKPLMAKSKKQRLQMAAPMVPIRQKMEQLKKKKPKAKMKKKEMKKKT